MTFRRVGIMLWGAGGGVALVGFYYGWFREDARAMLILMTVAFVIEALAGTALFCQEYMED